MGGYLVLGTNQNPTQPNDMHVSAFLGGLFLPPLVTDTVADPCGA